VGDTVTGQTERYRLGFTSGSLLTLEGVTAAATYREWHNWEEVRTRLTAVNALQARTAASSAARESTPFCAVSKPSIPWTVEPKR
jgi:hypothetical protein